VRLFSYFLSNYCFLCWSFLRTLDWCSESGILLPVYQSGMESPVWLLQYIEVQRTLGCSRCLMCTLPVYVSVHPANFSSLPAAVGGLLFFFDPHNFARVRLRIWHP